METNDTWDAFKSDNPSLDRVDLACFSEWLCGMGLNEVALTLEQLNRIYFGYLVLDCYWCILMWDIRRYRSSATCRAKLLR